MNSAQPEISRRCPSCGVSVRETVALFCPECGQALTNTVDEDKPHVISTSDEAVNNFLGRYKETVEASESNESASVAGPDGVPEATTVPTATPQPSVIDPKPAARTSEPAQPVVYSGAKHEKARERLHRASNVARGVIGDEVKRVERIRHVSSAMIEGATYDPSLRFVLVAIGIFIVFVILLVLSKVMG